DDASAVRRTFSDFLVLFPYELTSGRLGFIELFYAAHCYLVHFEGRSEGEVAGLLYCWIADEPLPAPVSGTPRRAYMLDDVAECWAPWLEDRASRRDELLEFLQNGVEELEKRDGAAEASKRALSLLRAGQWLASAAVIHGPSSVIHWRGRI